MGLDSRSKYVPQAVVTALGGTPGNGEKRRFLSRKSMILGVWGALGAGWARAWNRAAFQDPFYAEKLSHLGAHFEHFLVFFRVYF